MRSQCSERTNFQWRQNDSSSQNDYNRGILDPLHRFHLPCNGTIQTTPTQTSENQMNINIRPSILKTASHHLCEQVANGNCLVATKVRDNGNILEWHFANGDIIEVINNVDYSTGLALTPTTSICHWRDGDCLSERMFINDQPTY